MIRRIALALAAAAAALALAAPASSQGPTDPENPGHLVCQATPGTGDATCPVFLLPAQFRGFCAYAFDSSSGGSTWNLDLYAVHPDIDFTWTAAGGASKAAANEGATCWYPTTLTTAPTIFGQTADVVVTSVPVKLKIIVDKTAAVTTAFQLYIFMLR